MKHYFWVRNYFEVRLTQPIYSPVDGVVLYLVPPFGSSDGGGWIEYEEATGMAPPADYRDWDILIRPDEAQNVWITHMHVNPLDEIVATVPVSNSAEMMLGSARPALAGFRVKAGDLIGHGLGEIIVTRHLDGSGVPSQGCNSKNGRDRFGDLPGCQVQRQHHSIFEFMTDEVFAQYRAVADVTRDDFIVTAEERSAAPFKCEGENFVTRDVDAYVFLQGSPETEESTPAQESAASEVSLPSTEFLADGRAVLASFDGSGSPQLESFAAAADYALVVASDGGPIKVTVDDGSGERSIYDRPESSGISTYETSALGTGNISVAVEAAEQVGWRIVAITLP